MNSQFFSPQVPKVQKRLFFINKIPKEAYPTYPDKKYTLFENPETFLKLPSETQFNFIVGKRPRITKFSDLKYNKSKRYEFVGIEHMTKINRIIPNIKIHEAPKKRRPTAFSKENLLAPGNDNSLKKKMIQKVSLTTLVDKDIKEIFNKHKKLISINIIKKEEKKGLKNLPKVMEQFIVTPLKAQEKALNLNKIYDEVEKKIEKNITKKLRVKKKYNNRTGIALTETCNLMKNSRREFRMNLEKKKYIENIEKNSRLNNFSQDWKMSLRETKYIEKPFLKTEKSEKYPYILNSIKKFSLEDEYDSKLSRIRNYTCTDLDKVLKTQKNISQEKEKDNTNFKNYSNLAIYLNKISNLDNLEVKGKKLIDIEEKLLKEMKGKKKLIKYKYVPESIKDLNIKINYSIKNHSLSFKY